MSVRVERSGPVTTVILSRAEVKNAVDGPTAEALVSAFRAFEGDESAKVAVLWGEGGTFCAGADLKAIADGRGSRIDPEGDGPMGPTRMRLGKPVIAAVSGACVAGGLELALWCDLRVADESAFFGVFCRRWGVPLIDGGTVRLPRVVGVSRALDMILTGREVKVEEAHAMGLVNRVVKEGESRGAAEALARELAQLPEICLRSDRESVYDAIGVSEAVAMRREFELGLRPLSSGETLAGADRFSKGAGRHGRKA